MSYKPSSSPVERLYFGVVICVGSAIAVWSAFELFNAHVPSQWMVLAALTLLTGSFTIRIPRLSIRISVSDAFVFASVLLFGSHVATVIVAVDSLVATFWMRPANRSLFRSAFNLSVASFSIWIAATAFFAIAGGLPTPGHLVLTQLLWPLFVLASLYFLFNSWMIAVALGFEQRTSFVTLWWRHFPWFSLNYFGGVSAAALLVSYTRSVDLGAVSIILPLLVISYFTYRTSLDRVQDAQRHLEQMNELYMSTIEALAMAVDAKDQITHGHIRRVQVYALELAKRLGVVEPAQLGAIETAALLHDMGKLAIPEHILNKPGKLTKAEFDRMKRHADIGADLLSSIKFPWPVVPIVRHHHENWNGGGYPSGIAGTDIPLGARILSVVDCFDALTSDRPYRPRLSNDEAFSIIRERQGVMYDPLVVDTFIRVFDEISPAAIKAGLEARSMISGEQSEADAQRRADTTETTLPDIGPLPDIREQLASASTPVDVIDRLRESLRELTPATTFALYLYEASTDSLVCHGSSGDPRQLLTGLRIPMGDRVTGWCAANRRTSVNSDAYLDLGALGAMFAQQLRCTICVPLVRDDKVTGVLTAYSSTRDAFNESHRDLFEQAAAITASHPSMMQTDASDLASVLASPRGQSH